MLEAPPVLDEQSTDSELAAKISQFPAASVAVFGDFCLDVYWTLDAGDPELSLETKLPVRRVRTQAYSLGGAGNVISNLAALGVSKLRAIGTVGDDLFSVQMMQLLDRCGADRSGIVSLPAPWQTFVYAKPILAEEELNRIDFGAFNELPSSMIDRLAQQLALAARGSDVVVLNQQIPSGISTAAMIERINRVIGETPDTTFIVDARDHAALYRGAVLKLNSAEAARLLGKPVGVGPGSESDDRRAAEAIFAKTGRPVFLTRGAKGMVVADERGVHLVQGIQIAGPTDTVGAGDTVVATLAGALGSGLDALSAARLANMAAAVTVQKLQTTGTASPVEIAAIAESADFIYAPDLAEDARQATFAPGTEIEIVEPLNESLHIQHAIFDHDGTLSVLREGWERVMEPMMVRAVLGDAFDSVDASIYRKVLETVRIFIDQTTGIQTLVQMQGLVRLVRDNRYVPADRILDEHGYKKIYNDALLKLIHTRVQKLRSGELDSLDFQVKNAKPLLEALQGAGIKLYLASGTDVADVIEEATAMGYAHLFEGRIFGAVGDVKVEAKKVVLERIIRDNNLRGHEFVTFGDGPVEMRETRKRGGVCVGVASDEVRRFGMNLSKRTRLIRAGATLVVPDFSQLPALLGVLQIKGAH